MWAAGRTRPSRARSGPRRQGRGWSSRSTAGRGSTATSLQETCVPFRVEDAAGLRRLPDAEVVVARDRGQHDWPVRVDHGGEDRAQAARGAFGGQRADVLAVAVDV